VLVLCYCSIHCAALGCCHDYCNNVVGCCCVVNIFTYILVVCCCTSLLMYSVSTCLCQPVDDMLARAVLAIVISSSPGLSISRYRDVDTKYTLCSFMSKLMSRADTEL